MKAFEKSWINTTAKKDVGCTIDEDICSKVKACAVCKKLQKIGWRACLEWMKEKLKHEIQPGDIEYFIDQELEVK